VVTFTASSSITTGVGVEVDISVVPLPHPVKLSTGTAARIAKSNRLGNHNLETFNTTQSLHVTVANDKLAAV
jgi:hypothetical protein